MSTLTVISGPIYSGKTNYFIQTVKGFKQQGIHVLTLKPVQGSRYARNDVVSHDGEVTDGIAIDEAYEILDYLDDDRDIQAVAIDEVQFFGWDFIEIVEDLLKRGIHLILSGLDLDFKGQPFGIMPHLLSFATQVKKMQAVCRQCGEPAHRSQRLVDDRPAKRTDPLVIEADHIRYEARCLAHYELL
jgi:thymidine kinase